MREFVEAVRAEGLRVGLYFSLIDWHHPDFTIDYHHPYGMHRTPAHRTNAATWSAYRAYLHGQVREVLTGYGPLDYLFYDFTYDEPRDGWAGKGPQDWDAEALLAMTANCSPASWSTTGSAFRATWSHRSSTSPMRPCATRVVRWSGRPARPQWILGIRPRQL